MTAVTKKLEEILNRIGWARARVYNPSIFFHAWQPDANGGLFAHSKVQLDAARQSIMQIETYISKAIEEYETLPEKVQKSLRTGLFWPEDWDSDRDVAAEAIALLERYLAALFEVRGFLEHESSTVWESGGRPPNAPAYRLAENMAEIYVLGMGEKPTFGSSGTDWRKPTGQFAIAFRDACDELGIQISDIKGPCRAAITGLTEDRMRNLLRLRQLPSLIAMHIVSKLPKGKSLPD